jgi:hypothetical protein
MHLQNRGRGGRSGGFLRLRQLLTAEGHWEVVWRPYVNRGVVLANERTEKTTPRRRGELTAVLRNGREQRVEV